MGYNGLLLVSIVMLRLSNAAILAESQPIDVIRQLSQPRHDDAGNQFPNYWLSYECSSLSGPTCDYESDTSENANDSPSSFPLIVDAVRETVVDLITDPLVDHVALEIVLQAITGKGIKEFRRLYAVEDVDGDDDFQESFDDDESYSVPLHVIGKSFMGHTFSIHLQKHQPNQQKLSDNNAVNGELISKELVIIRGSPIDDNCTGLMMNEKSSRSQATIDVPLDMILECNRFDIGLFNQFRCVVVVCDDIELQSRHASGVLT